MARIPEQLRQQVAERAKRCCEYCHAQEDIVLYLEVDHIVPTSASGETTLKNLCFACKLCNGSKHKAQTAIDPETGEEVLLFNPRTQTWAEHFAWSGDAAMLIGLTPIGRATILRLKINSERRVRARKRWVKVGWHPPKL